MTYVHGISAGRLLAGVTLGQTPVNSVGKRVFPEVGQELLINLESGEVFCKCKSANIARHRSWIVIKFHHILGPEQILTRSLDSLLGESIDSVGLVSGGVDEAVVDDLDLCVLVGQRDDLVGDGRCLGEGGDGPTGASEGKTDVLGGGTRQLGLALLANDDQVVGVGLLGIKTTDVTGQTRVNTAAETLVGGADDQQGLLVGALEGLGLGLGEDLVRSGTVDLGVGHGALGAGQLGGGDNLHGLGDLLDVADGLETGLNLTEGGIAGGGGGDGAVGGDVSWLAGKLARV